MNPASRTGSLAETLLTPPWSEAFTALQASDFKQDVLTLMGDIGEPNIAAPRHGEATADMDRLRKACVEAHGTSVAAARERGKSAFFATNDGMLLGDYLATTNDKWIQAVCGLGILYLQPRKSLLRRAASMAYPTVVAVGGYGRGLMSPHSDLDIMLLVEASNDYTYQFCDFLLCTLWDCGISVGHSVRTLSECIAAASRDHTIRTALLETRAVWGAPKRHDRMRTSLKRALKRWDRLKFVAAKLDERDERLKVAGQTRYLREPNVKDGKGALRDLQMIRWLALCSGDGNTGVSSLVKRGILGADDYRTYLRCHRFLRTVRSHIHYIANRDNNTLTYECQLDIANQLGYRNHQGVQPVERMMRHYYHIVRNVGELVRVVCAGLERNNHKASPVARIVALGKRGGNAAREVAPGIVLEGHRPTIDNPKQLASNPQIIMHLFDYVTKTGADIHPETRKYLLHSKKWRAPLRGQQEVYSQFLAILTRGEPNSFNALRQMHETGVLRVLIPPFAAIEALVPFNRYHFYAVDEHLLRTVQFLAQMESGRVLKDVVLQNALKNLPSRRALYVAALLHDVAKGGNERHEIAGEKIVLALGSQLTLDKDETALAAWLVRHHLDLSERAQRRDISDPRTVADFAALVENQDRLRLLLALTLADVCAVGPQMLSSWKLSLFRNLFMACSDTLDDTPPRDPISTEASLQQAVRERLPQECLGHFDAFVAAQHSHYWRSATPERLARQCRTWMQYRGFTQATAGEEFIYSFASVSSVPDHAAGHTEVIYLARENKLFAAALAYGCAANDAGIISANLYATRGGDAIHTIVWNRKFDDNESEERLAARIAHDTKQFLQTAQVGDLPAPPTRSAASVAEIFTVENTITVDGTASAHAAIIDIQSADAPGLLYFLARTLYESDLVIISANVTTYGEKAVDSFYVRDISGNVPSAEVLQNLVGVLQQRLGEFHHPISPPQR